MITSVEKAKSNRSSCIGCENKIEKDEWRGVENVFSFFVKNLTKKYYCKSCAVKKLIEQQNKIKGQLKLLNSQKNLL